MIRFPAAGLRPVVLLAAGLLASSTVVACASVERPAIQGQPVPMATPLRSPGVALGAAVERLVDAAAAAGIRLGITDRPYRPSEPGSLLLVPRVVLRADLADPDDGFVVVYGAADDATATSLAQDLVRHLASGFGQTNYPADTRFSVAVLGDAVIFASWSPGRSSDQERAGAVFDAVSAVGQPVEIRR